jgi:hypothetical protein
MAGGNRVILCSPCPYDLTTVELVVVTGANWNPCGHALLYAGGMYFHIGELTGYPMRMNPREYLTYLRLEKKSEVRRNPVRIFNPAAARAKLEELLSKRWFWGVLPHNCVAFVEEILRAGGNQGHSNTNCPILEPWGTSLLPLVRRGA